jgi:glycosyltransferase involved in cell wall biosynthesis
MREIHQVLKAVYDIQRLVRRKGIRILHSNGVRAHVYGGLAAGISGIPEVWTTHTVEKPGLSTEFILGIPTTHVLANCPRTAGYFESRGLRTSLVWPGVNLAELNRMASGITRETLARRYSLPLDRPWIVSAARLQRFKGQHLLLKALGKLPQSLPFHGIVIGGSLFGQESEYQQELRVACRDLGLDSRVSFTGFVPDEDLAALLASSQILAHPALEEDFGLSVAEAQALGVPVVAFDAVGPAAIVVDGETGWLVPVGDYGQLADRLETALKASESWALMGQAGHQRVCSHFSAEQHAKLTQEIYSQSLDLYGFAS